MKKVSKYEIQRQVVNSTKSFHDLAREYKVSAERIRQIASEIGVDGRERRRRLTQDKLDELPAIMKLIQQQCDKHSLEFRPYRDDERKRYSSRRCTINSYNVFVMHTTLVVINHNTYLRIPKRSKEDADFYLIIVSNLADKDIFPCLIVPKSLMPEKVTNVLFFRDKTAGTTGKKPVYKYDVYFMNWEQFLQKENKNG